MHGPEEITAFWIDEIGPKGWYVEDETLDATIRDRFGALWEKVRGGAVMTWGWGAQAALARLIVADQFPRNMFRGDGRSFATDGIARRWAKEAVSRRLDQRIPPPQRQFFFLPLMHSEVLDDQDQSVRMFLSRMPQGNDNLRHARAHRQVIRDFGRFPYRNAALGRASSAAEKAYLAAGGYGWTLNHIDEVGGGSWHASG